MSIRIVTDSGADLEAWEYEELGVGLIPLSITVDQRTYEANALFNKLDFFRMLENAEIFPSTSQPAPAEFQSVFEAARENGDELIYISLSSALSGTWQCANLVRELEGFDNVHIVDSRSATLGQKLLVLQAVKLREKGFSAADIAEELRALVFRIRIFAGVDTLEYLQKGGRLSKAAASIGTLARVKPVITVTQEGTVHVHGKGLGKAKAMSIIVSAIEKDMPDTDYPILGVYSGAIDNLTELRIKTLKMGVDVSTEKCYHLGPVIGAHVGPGAYGIAYIAKQTEEA